MNVIISLGHPAHFHLFRNMANALLEHGHFVKFVLTEKDVLVQLLNEYSFDYEILAKRKNNETFVDKLKKVLKSTKKLYDIVDSFRPDVMIGCISQMAWVGFIKSVPTIFCGEDDFDYTYLQGLITYPFVSFICAPKETNIGPFKRKKIAYNGYQKLAYLHPNVFVPDDKKLGGIDVNQPFFILRLVNLVAHHDVNIKGLNGDLIGQILKKLEKRGVVYISSEKELSKDLQKYKLPINVKYIHHAMAFSNLFLGDSQSMAVEASMLGVPNIRYNDFAGKINVLNEIENHYGLTNSLGTKYPQKLLDLIDSLLDEQNLKESYQLKRNKMLNDKIDVTAFFVWFIENYPESARIMKENPDYQYNFR